MAYTNRRCHFIKRPQGMPGDDCFEWRDETVPALEAGEFLIRNEYFSFEASMRTWMNEGPNYMPPLQIDEVMRGPTMGVVVESRDPDFPEGARVMGMHGWERYSVARSGPFEQIIPDVPGVSPTIFMGVLGLVGMTAYFGIEDICRPAAGETLLVSGAAGAVGSVAAQLGKIHGARVVGIAGADDKCNWLREECGVDVAINYRESDLRAAIGDACPDGINAYFDNVGGDTLDAALWHMKDKGRVACCGTIAGYNDSDAPSPPVHNLWLVVIRQLTLQGFLISDYFDRFGEAGEKLMGWVQAGQLQHREHILQGLENAPEAMRTLLTGRNRGKTLLKL